MSYLDMLRTLDVSGEFSEMPRRPTDKTNKTPSTGSFDSFVSTPTGPFENIAPPVVDKARTMRVYRVRVAMADGADKWAVLLAAGCDLPEARRVAAQQFGNRVRELIEVKRQARRDGN